MHTHLVAGAFFSLAICLLLGAGLSAIVHATGRRNVDFLLFAAAAAMVAVYSAGLGLAYEFGVSERIDLWALGIRVARGSALLAVPTVLVFSLRFARLRHDRLVLLALWLPAVAFSLLVMRAPLDLALHRVDRMTELGLQIDQAWAPVGLVPRVVLGFGPALMIIVCAVFARSYLQGRREALALFVGASVFTLAVLNDVLLALGVLRGLHLMPLGFLSFAFTVALYFALRYSATRSELSRNIKELRDRTNELTQSRHELVAIQTELGKKEQLAVIGEMAAVIAHEVRNPLAVISNAVASLRREGLCRQDHDVLLGILDEEAIRLNRLVTDLLAYARPVNVQRQRVVLHDLVQRAALLVGSRNGTRFEFDETSTKGQVWADANLLRQVFDNIIENAVQAMGGGGVVSASVKPAERDGIEGFAVTVSDEGEGMDTMVRSRARDPFFTTRPSGTGLGLAIVSRIVEAHGGSLTLDSHAGEGTSVTVFLPIGAEGMPLQDVRHGSRPDSDPPSISSRVPRAEL